MRTALATLTLTLFVAPAAVKAQATEPAGTKATADTIIVTGSPITNDRIADFVKAVTVETSGDQLAAFHAPVCPVSFGLPSAFNAVVEERIRAVAGQAGIEVAGEGCSPNITVFIPNDGAELITRLTRRGARSPPGSSGRA